MTQRNYNYVFYGNENPMLKLREWILSKTIDEEAHPSFLGAVSSAE